MQPDTRGPSLSWHPSLNEVDVFLPCCRFRGGTMLTPVLTPDWTRVCSSPPLSPLPECLSPTASLMHIICMYEDTQPGHPAAPTEPFTFPFKVGYAGLISVRSVTMRNGLTYWTSQASIKRIKQEQRKQEHFVLRSACVCFPQLVTLVYVEISPGML